MQRLEVSGAVRPIYGSLGFKRLKSTLRYMFRVCEAILSQCTAIRKRDTLKTAHNVQVQLHVSVFI